MGRAGRGNFLELLGSVKEAEVGEGTIALVETPRWDAKHPAPY